MGMKQAGFFEMPSQFHRYMAAFVPHSLTKQTVFSLERKGARKWLEETLKEERCEGRDQLFLRQRIRMTLRHLF